MVLENKNILLVSPEPWNHIFVSKHHYAVHLAKRGNKVFFLNPPSRKGEILSTDYPNISIVNYKGFVTGLRYFPKRIRSILVLREYLRLQVLCSVEFDVVWSFDNSVFYDFDALPTHPIKISHIVDLNQDFQTKTASRTADLCFCTTESIKSRLIKYNQWVFKINHGFCGHSLEERHPFLPGGQKIKALYAGNLGMPYIDWRLLENVVRQSPHVDFIFVGPDPTFDQSMTDIAASRNEVLSRPNVFLLGRVESGALQGYYAQADLLLVAYQEKYHKEQANPHKMMEYLGSGKVVVASFTSEYLELSEQGLILMSVENDKYPVLFSRAVEELTFWNSASFIQARKKYAMENSYDKQIDRIQCIMENHSI